MSKINLIHLWYNSGNIYVLNLGVCAPLSCPSGPIVAPVFTSLHMAMLEKAEAVQTPDFMMDMPILV